MRGATRKRFTTEDTESAEGGETQERSCEKREGRAWSTGLGTAPDDLGLLDDEDLLICGLGLSEYVTATSSREKTNECRKNRQQSFFVTL